VECPACRAGIPEGSRFCPSCGHALRSRAEERRVVTVLFADLVGYTAMAEGVDPEQVKNLVDRAFQRLVVDIVDHGGRVDKIVGDQIMAIFGAPVAHEDDAERAVRAALQLQRTLACYADEVGVPIDMRVGVNTGEALVGTLHAAGEYTAMGDAVNVASRLQTYARPGQVVVGENTHAETAGAIEYEAVGAVQVRGREEPVQAYVAIAALGPPGLRPERSRSPLKGRDQELAMLCASLDMAFRRRRPHTMVMVGEAGIGKSRLAHELRRTAMAEHDAKVLDGRCVPYGEANLWWPFAEAVRQAFDIAATDTAEQASEKTRTMVSHGSGLPADHPDAVRVTDGLLYLLGLPSALQDVEPARAREEATRAFIALLQALARMHPLVLVLSELHWADPFVLELVDRLPDRMRGLPFVLVATARPELEERWTPAPNGRNLLLLHLDPLERGAAAELVEALLEGAGAARPELVEAVLDRAGGNPFFLEELTALVHQAPRGSDNGAQLPGTLRSLVATRLDALPTEERRVLDHAAVVGRLGSIESLAALDDGTTTNLRRVLEELSAKDMMDVSGGDWSFRSDLIREVAYETLTKAERARHHARLGTYLANQARERDREREHLEAIAHQLGVAAELVRDLGSVDGVGPEIVDEAVEAIARAAEAAERRETPAIVARLADRALALLPPGASAARRRFLVRRGKARTLLRQFDAARADVAQVVSEAEAEGDEWSVAAALTVRGHIEQGEGALYESVANLDEALARWRRLGDRGGEAEALRLRGLTDMFLGRLTSAEETIARALSLYVDLEDRRGEAWAQWTMAWIAFTGGDTTRADEQIAIAVRLFEEIGDYGGLGWAYGLLAWVRLQQGYLDEADRLAELALRERGIDADHWALGMMLMLRASTRLWRGLTDDAVRLAKEARGHFKAIGDATGELRSVATLGRALVAAGRITEADDVLRAAHRMAERELDPGNRSLGSVMALGLAIQLGDVTKAAEVVAKAGELPVTTPPGDQEVFVGLALLQLGRVEDAVTRLRSAFERAPGPGMRTNAGSALALALAAAGRADEAVAQADAVDGPTGDAEGGGTYLDRIALHHARGFAALRRDAELAVEHFDEAVAIADGTGDRLAQALTRLARARAMETRWHPRSGPALQEAETRLATVGLRDTAWDDVYRRAARAG
jgi:class 3 adenylate cyclase/tetratricopeptide (TPR) repeat protein